MIDRPRNRRRIDDYENPDRWVVSYADFITLLFAFFTALFAISHVDAGKLQNFTGSIRTAFKADVSDRGDSIVRMSTFTSPDIADMEQEFLGVLYKLKIKEDVSVYRDVRGVVISFGDNVLFDVGQSIIKEEAFPMMSAIISVIQKSSNNFIIEGHTDNIPINSSTSKYASNWELSVARATSVVNYVSNNFNISPARLSASGYAEFKPVASNASPEGRAKNRRVDIVVLHISDNKID